MGRTRKVEDLEVITIGEPNIEALSKWEQKAFLKTLLDDIIKLKQQDNAAKQNRDTNSENNNKN